MRVWSICWLVLVSSSVLAQPRVTQLPPARIAEVIDHGRLKTEALDVLFDFGQRPMFRLDVPGREALAWWRAFRAVVETSGYWPIILGSPQDAEPTLEVGKYYSE